MKPEYERTSLIITEFDTEDEITTSGAVNPDSQIQGAELENRYVSYNSLRGPGGFF